MADETTEPTTPILSRLRAPKGAVRPKRRPGRGHGSGLGTTAGKGAKGQKSRHPGNFSKLGFEGGQMPLQRRLPKLGFYNPFSKRVENVNVKDLSRFEAGTTVTIELLKESGLIRRNFDRVKVLGDGAMDRALTVQVHAFSAAAKSKIEQAGGTAELVPAPKTAEADAATAEGA